MKMPAPDSHVLERRAEIIASLRDIVPGEGVIDTHEELRAYESDGLTAYRQVPMVVVLPETTAQVAAILRLCDAERVKVVPRGAGTSLSGGAIGRATTIWSRQSHVNGHRRASTRLARLRASSQNSGKLSHLWLLCRTWIGNKGQGYSTSRFWTRSRLSMPTCTAK